ncbi:type VI secretion system baseplate subunit TssG [Desulfocurvibacter africanus]|uniref:type VI secretion system baseplate subunit TssG n=1 Tax=Desulfocurvibacter africanus TaxID=873 RepID=UPI00041A926A|nr:type VI secretion system baseplate subunit TssG [Desulfocurvibacter africanus]
MAGESRRQAPDLKGDLLGQGRSYSFIQAVRLLRLLEQDGRGADPESFLAGKIMARPLLSLGFPATDISSIEEIGEGQASFYRITATFMGLYGASSPLPTFYTEDLLDEASEDSSISRDFLDILNTPFYRLFYRCWSKYRWWTKIYDEQDPEYVGRLLCLVGLGHDGLRSKLPFAFRLLRYAGLLTQFPRSALGLATLLADALNIPSLCVVPLIPRRVRIPQDQVCRLGAQATTLGEDCHLGSETMDCMSAFRITTGPLTEDRYHGLLSGEPDAVLLGSLVEFYLQQPLECDLELSLARDQVQPARLGEDTWSRLGEDTWMFCGQYPEAAAAARFPVEQGQSSARIHHRQQEGCCT